MKNEGNKVKVADNPYHLPNVIIANTIASEKLAGILAQSKFPRISHD